MGILSINNEMYSKEVDPQTFQRLAHDLNQFLVSKKNECVPILVRLAWHDAGSYDMNTKSGGSHAAMRFEPESKYSANNGLHIAREILEPFHQKYPIISYADLWQFAAVIAIGAAGGPKIPFRAGRIDADVSMAPDGRLPDATKNGHHLKDIFYNKGFNDQEIVALSGAHCLGHAHKDRSGFEGPWTRTPYKFTNKFFVLLNNLEWSIKSDSNPKQYKDHTGNLMMLPTDIALIQNEEFKCYVDKYAESESLFFSDFAKAFQKLAELGHENLTLIDYPSF